MEKINLIYTGSAGFEEISIYKDQNDRYWGDLNSKKEGQPDLHEYESFMEDYDDWEHTLAKNPSINEIYPDLQVEIVSDFERNETFRFNYMMLGRLQQDCEYYLGYGNRNEKGLWAGEEIKQVEKMKELYNSFPDNKKPQWISMDDIKHYESRMVKSRVEQLANKIGLKENAYCLEKMPEWIENSKTYAEKMMNDSNMNTKDVKEVRLTYLLNKLCPNLHHFKQEPFGTESIEQYNKMMSEYTMENSQAQFLDTDGKIIQKGVVKSAKEFDKFMSVMKKYVEISQNLAQLKNTDKDSWETIFGNADSTVFLGGKEPVQKERTDISDNTSGDCLGIKREINKADKQKHSKTKDVTKQEKYVVKDTGKDR